MSDAYQLRTRIAEIEAQIEPLRQTRDALRVELAAATAPFKVGDVIEKRAMRDRNRAHDRWLVEAVNPGRHGDDFDLILRNVRKDGSPGERTSQYYSFYDYVKVEP